MYKSFILNHSKTHTCKLISKKDMLYQPIWTASRIIMAKPQACYNSKISRPKAEMVDAAWDIEVRSFTMRTNYMCPNVSCRYASCGTFM